LGTTSALAVAVLLAGATDLTAVPNECATLDNQSPATFGGAKGEVNPAATATCGVVAEDPWKICHRHMHCPAEHKDAGICAGADCEVHEVYRKAKPGKPAPAEVDPEEGELGDNCVPADYHLLVRATFIDHAADCVAGANQNKEYCGSATGSKDRDCKPKDQMVTCAESGKIPVPVRFCIETKCVCQQKPDLHDEPTRERGCANVGVEGPCKPKEKCGADKIKGAGKAAECRLRLESTSAKTGVAPAGEKVAKCTDKLSQTFSKSEAKGGCATTGDAAAIEAKIDAFVADIDGEVGTTPPTENDCASAKLKAAGSGAKCRLTLEASELSKGVVPEAEKIQKCTDKLSASYAKADVKGGCSNPGDGSSIEGKIEAFVADVDSELDPPYPASASGAFLN
jgi:hypothetical protein